MNNFDLSFAGFTTSYDELPDNSKKALMILGYTTKIKNSTAGMPAGIMGTSKNPKDQWTDEEITEAAQEAGLTTWGRDEETVAALCKKTQSDMFDAIIQGVEPSTKRGRAPKLSDDEKLHREVAIDMMEKAFKEKGRVMPKRSKKEEKEAFEELLSRALAVEGFAEKVEAEFKARKKRLEAATGDDLDGVIF